MKLLRAVLFITLQFPLIAGAGIYSENTWEKKDISVCFADAEPTPRTESGYVLRVKNWNKSFKKKVEFWVNEEFSPERTGIHFTGWKSCKDSPEADVILFYNSNSYIKRFILGGLDGVAGELGPRRRDEVQGFPAARSIVAISKTGMNKGTAIHEFGHVAGLAHEHNHYDAPRNDESCPYYERHFSTQLEYKTFDRDSIMNYCSLKLKKLSEGDVRLLKELYP